MKILYVGLVYKDEEEGYLRKVCKNGISVAHHKYQKAFVEGLQECEDVVVAGAVPVGNFPQKCRKLFWKKQYDRAYIRIGFINFPILKYIVQFFTIKKEIKKWIAINMAEDMVIIVYANYLPFISAVSEFTKKYSNLKTIAIIPDLPGEKSIMKKNYSDKIYSKLQKKQDELFYKKIRYYDAYIPFSKYMMEAIQVEDKPSLVVEAITDFDYLPIKKNDNGKYIVMYTGELNKNVGIDLLIQAFEYLDCAYYELWICGSGEMQQEIENVAKKCCNIKYFGYVSKQKIDEMDESVDLYINPRQNMYEYTKYSFPSKNIEYLKTGKPVIAYKLDGIPDEYDNYLYYPQGNSVMELSNKIVEISKMSVSELNRCSSKQIEFVLKNKGKKVQGERISTFIRETVL